MNSYPSEYLLHPVPIFAVYGLTPAHTDASSSSPSPSQSDPPSQPSSSSPDSTYERRPTPSSRSTLATTLASIFSSKQTFSVYEAARYSNQQNPLASSHTPPVRVLFVDKGFTLPEKPGPPAPNLPAPHSTLSPLSPDSPLHPDGLMAPMWVKKHLETPAVVVGFYDLWDWSQEPGSPPRARRETGPLSSQVLIDPTEREKDSVLAQEINERRKYFQAKGVKFAAVLILKRQQTDDPAVEERLALLRKQSGLDNKLSFFTVAPGTQHDMQEFVNTLYRALYDPALMYYNNKIKKIRKKRNKLPPPSASSRTHLDTNEPQPLSIQGWMIRYELKTAIFQEFRQDIEAAVKTYEHAYTLISDMLAPSSSITPGQVGLAVRSKRWEEARTLIDCISIKIYRFRLFLNDPSGALAQANGHLHIMQSYCTNWGMGEQSFEYWAWLCKQYRIFADVVDSATQHGFKIPAPTVYRNQNPLTMPGSPLLGSSGNSGNVQVVGVNPGAILQHAGFYYHLAAMCCSERRRRFLEVDRKSDTPTAWDALLDRERQEDHSSITIELLTKSYEQFKKHRNQRMTLYLAAEIAGTYYETGKFEMALKFFERIGKTYRKENWYMVLTSILRWSLRCAKELQSWDRVVECLVELLASELPMPEQKRADSQKELMDVLNRPSTSAAEDGNNSGSEPQALTIQMDQINPFLQCQVQFKARSSFVDTPTHFQITVKSQPDSPPLPLRFTRMRILFSDAQYNYDITDAGLDESAAQPTEMISCDDEKTANLVFVKNQTKVFQGSITPRSCEDLKIVGVCFDIKTDSWQLGLEFGTEGNVPEEQAMSRRKWLEDASSLKYVFLDGRGEVNTVRVSRPPPRVQIKVDHAAQALLDEHFALQVTIHNEEETAIDATLRVDVKNDNNQDTTDTLSFSASEPPCEKREAAIGQIEPAQASTYTILLCGSEVAGTRTVTLTVCYKSANSETIEKQHVLRIPFKSPFESNYKLFAQCEKFKDDTSPDLVKSERWTLTAGIRCCSPTDLEICRVDLDQTPFEHPHTTLSLIKKPHALETSQTWQPEHVYSGDYTFRLKTNDATETQLPVPVGSVQVHWRRSGSEGPFFMTALRLPHLEFRRQNLVVIADAPKELYVGEPFTVKYTVYNPTVHLAEYTASVELSDAFVFAGLKLLKGRVLPLSRASYYYTCYPLAAGRVRLPRLKVVAKQQGLEKEIPTEMAADDDTSDDDTRREWPPLLTFVNARRYF